MMAFGAAPHPAGGTQGACLQKRRRLFRQYDLLRRFEKFLRLAQAQSEVLNCIAVLVEYHKIMHSVCLPILGHADQLKFELHRRAPPMPRIRAS